MHKLHKRLQLKLTCRRQRRTLRQLGPTTWPLVDFASNDYLGYARDAQLNQLVAAELAEASLYAASGSRLLTGNSPLLESLERRLAELFHAESALFFNSGYTLNLGLLQAVCESGDAIIMDEWCHASIKDGARLSKAAAYYFRHNDLNHLAHKIKRLQTKPKVGQVFVVVESVYSMDGDVADLEELVRLCEAYEAALIVDEAHGVGTIGRWGEGLVSSLGLEKRVFARVHTFGKALGSHGAALLGAQTLKDYLINFCHSFIYTTALSCHSLARLFHSLNRLHNDPSDFQRLQANIEYMNAKLRLQNHPSPIYSFIVPEVTRLQALARRLKDEGLFVLPIYSPTVKRGSERLRVCIHSYNSAEDIDRLIEELSPYDKIWEEPICNGY